MSSEKTPLKNIVTVFPFISVLIILAGYVSAARYYKKFGIEIFYFLEPSEIVTIFLGNYGVYINAVTLVMAIAISVNPVLNGIKGETISLNIFSWFVLYIGFIAIWAFSFISLAEFNVYWSYNYVPIIIILLLLAFVFRYKDQNTEFEFFRLRFIELSSFFVLLFLAFHTAEKDYFLVYQKKKYYGHTITLKNGKQRISDSTNYFIGQTRNYIFWFNQEKNVYSVIKTEEIEEIVSPRFKFNLESKSTFDR